LVSNTTSPRYSYKIRDRRKMPQSEQKNGERRKERSKEQKTGSGASGKGAPKTRVLGEERWTCDFDPEEKFSRGGPAPHRNSTKNRTPGEVKFGVHPWGAPKRGGGT